MKLKYIILSVALIITIVGCTTPQYTTLPDGTVQTNQVVDPKLEQALLMATGVNAATAPVNPYSGLIALALGLTTAAATFVAAKKNSDMNKQKAAADSLAEAIVSLGSAAIDQATKASVANGAATEVAAHIDNNTTVAKSIS